jgi:hypothetical protein
MHGEFLRLIFVQAHRETEAHFNAAGMSSQNYQTDELSVNGPEDKTHDTQCASVSEGACARLCMYTL